MVTNTPITKSAPIPLTLSAAYEWSKYPHISIYGQTGSGKTSQMVYFLAEFARRKADIFIVDPKAELLYLENYLPDNHVATTLESIFPMLDTLVKRMGKRHKDISQSGKLGANWLNTHNYCPVVLFMDEVGAFTAMLDKKDRDHINNLIKQIIFKGRSAGFQIVMASQSPIADSIPGGTAVRDQVALRISLGDTSLNDRKMIFGEVDSYPPRSNGFGTGWYQILGQQKSVRSYQAPDLTDFTMAQLGELLSALPNASLSRAEF